MHLSKLIRASRFRKHLKLEPRSAVHRQSTMARTMMTSRKSTGGKVPRLQLARQPRRTYYGNRFSSLWAKVQWAVRVRRFALAWLEHHEQLACAPGGRVHAQGLLALFSPPDGATEVPHEPAKYDESLGSLQAVVLERLRNISTERWALPPAHPGVSQAALEAAAEAMSSTSSRPQRASGLDPGLAKCLHLYLPHCPCATDVCRHAARVVVQVSRRWRACGSSTMRLVAR